MPAGPRPRVGGATTRAARAVATGRRAGRGGRRYGPGRIYKCRRSCRLRVRVLGAPGTPLRVVLFALHGEGCGWGYKARCVGGVDSTEESSVVMLGQFCVAVQNCVPR